jgi:hypothetical protein
MNRKFRAYALILAVALAVTAAPAIAHASVDEELAAYWHSAAPLYEQINALGDRQTQIYLEFGLSLGDDAPQIIEDSEYEAYVRGLGALTEDELRTLISVNAQIAALYDEADEFAHAYEHAQTAMERTMLSKLIHEKYEAAEALSQSIESIDEKLRIAEETAYVMGLEGLTESAQNELLSMYETQRSVEKQLAALEAALSEAARSALYGEEG